MRNEEKLGGKSRLLVVPVALLAIGGLWLAALAPSALANKGAKKDLAVVSVKHKGYALAGEDLKVEMKVANRGRKAAGGEVTVTVDDASLPNLPGQDVPGGDIGKIAAGKAAGFEVPIHAGALGRYSIEVCARSKGDKKKGNNCRKGKDFSVIPSAWKGTASATGTETLGGATVNVSTQPTAYFYFDKLTPSGFRYTGEGTVKETISGGSLCTSKGSGTFGITSESTLLLSEDMEVYAAGGVSPPGRPIRPLKPASGWNPRLLLGHSKTGFRRGRGTRIRVRPRSTVPIRRPAGVCR